MDAIVIARHPHHSADEENSDDNDNSPLLDSSEGQPTGMKTSKYFL